MATCEEEGMNAGCCWVLLSNKSVLLKAFYVREGWREGAALRRGVDACHSRLPGRIFLKLPMTSDQARIIETAKVGDGLLTGERHW